ncbi:MAG TPA: hypothetical protein VE713_15515 [Pyrinomonadaceae bacterium]|jgi:hypothetical protein|nr:hypothetical protein [Pyrinomonadaceae bacterium]
MKRVFVKLVVVAAVAAFCVQARAQGARGGEAPLTNASVVKLVRAGFSEKAVIAIIRARPVNFDLAPERLIELKKSGVGEKIILAMIGRGGVDELAGEDWGDDLPLGEPGRGGDGAGRQSPGGEPGSTDIFGSSGGSKGRVRSRGMSGGVDSDTQTTGSATVHIIRPPAEGGGDTQTKLERTPTLTDDSIVELVEAGFSEGTIIRRIEQSPVEFDLSPAKLAELRKRRVSDPVIAAMRAAMGEDAHQPARPEK